jgi:hypothetical protein
MSTPKTIGISPKAIASGVRTPGAPAAGDALGRGPIGLG